MVKLQKRREDEIKAMVTVAVRVAGVGWGQIW